MKLIAVMALLFLSVPLVAEDLEKLAEINIEELALSQFPNYSSSFQSLNRQAVGTFVSIDFYDILQKYIGNEKVNAMIGLENCKGQMHYCSMDMFNPSINAISPMLIIERNKYKLGDTLRISDDDQLQLFDGLNIINQSVQRRNIRLQISKLTTNDLSFFSNNCLIFPTDISSERWIKDIKRIFIYQITKGER